MDRSTQAVSQPCFQHGILPDFSLLHCENTGLLLTRRRSYSVNLFTSSSTGYRAACSVDWFLQCWLWISSDIVGRECILLHWTRVFESLKLKFSIENKILVKSTMVLTRFKKDKFLFLKLKHILWRAYSLCKSYVSWRMANVGGKSKDEFRFDFRLFAYNSPTVQ